LAFFASAWLVSLELASLELDSALAVDSSALAPPPPPQAVITAQAAKSPPRRTRSIEREARVMFDIALHRRPNEGIT
jgi:hypothetical protein